MTNQTKSMDEIILNSFKKMHDEVPHDKILSIGYAHDYGFIAGHQSRNDEVQKLEEMLKVAEEALENVRDYPARGSTMMRNLADQAVKRIREMREKS